MHRTQFAGLTAPDPNDSPLTVDGGSFVTRNPDITDHFLRVGAVTHRHDEHDPLANPIVAASAAIDPTTGSIPSDRTIYVGFTVVDEYGGETTLSPVVSVATPAALDPPSSPPDATFDSSAGVLPVGSYYYALTLLDQGGGETMIGPAVLIERPPGSPTGQINFTGLSTWLGPDAGSTWRMWRADNGGQFNLIAAGTDDTFTDPGIDPVDHAATPPATSDATHATNTLNITMPDGTTEPTFNDPIASGFALYISDDGSFSNPCLYDAYPLASAGAAISIADLEVLPGSPPLISTSIPGAHKITAAELADDVALGSGGGGSSLIIQDHNFDLPVRSRLNFAGNLSVSDDGSDVITVQDNGLSNFLSETFAFSDFSSYGTKQHVNDWGSSGEVQADAAGNDGRVLANGGDGAQHQRATLRIAAVETDGIAGLMFNASDIDNFILGQIHMTASPFLEVAYASGGVITALASAAIDVAVVDDMCVSFELGLTRMGDHAALGVGLYAMDPTLTTAAPVCAVGYRFPYTDPLWSTFVQSGGLPVNGLPGFRIVPDAGGSNALRVSDWFVDVA